MPTYQTYQNTSTGALVGNHRNFAAMPHLRLVSVEVHEDGSKVVTPIVLGGVDEVPNPKGPEGRLGADTESDSGPPAPKPKAAPRRRTVKG